MKTFSIVLILLIGLVPTNIFAQDESKEIKNTATRIKTDAIALLQLIDGLITTNIALTKANTKLEAELKKVKADCATTTKTNKKLGSEMKQFSTRLSAAEGDVKAAKANAETIKNKYLTWIKEVNENFLKPLKSMKKLFTASAEVERYIVQGEQIISKNATKK